MIIWKNNNLTLIVESLWLSCFEHQNAESEGLRFDTSGDSEFFLCPTLVTRRKKKLLLYCFTELKTYHLSYFYLQTLRYRHTDRSSMQDACHMNFVIDLAHRGVSVAQWLEHRSAESEGLRFDFL